MKKGKVNWLMVSIIIAVLGLISALFILQAVGSKFQVDVSALNDATCKTKISTLSVTVSESDTAEAIQKLATASEAFRASCIPQTETIDPQDWDKCDSYFKGLATSEPTIAATNCAMQQVAKRIERCWDMSGEGRRTAFSWSCFNIVISNKGLSPEVSDYGKFKTKIINSFNCERNEKDCLDTAADSINDATLIAAYNNIVSLKEAKIKDMFDLCRFEEDTDYEFVKSGITTSGIFEENSGGTELLCKSTVSNEACVVPTGPRNQKIATFLNGGDVDEEPDVSCFCPPISAEEIYEELTTSNAQSLVRKYSNEKIIPFGTEEINCNINEMSSTIIDDLRAISDMKSKLIPREENFIQFYNAAHPLDVPVTEYNQLPFQLVKDTRLETDTIKFTQADLKHFMKNIKIESRGISYCDSLSRSGKDCTERLNFYPSERFEVKQNNLFSIEYCGDTLPLFSNMVASSVCDTGNQNRKIIISETPTGGGSRLINENLKLDCPIMEAAAKIPGVGQYLTGARDICQTGVTRLLL